MLAKHCLQEFKLDCQLRRLTERTIKGYYNNTLNFLNYAEKHHEVVEVEEIRTVHIKHYVQYLLNKKTRSHLHQRNLEMPESILSLCYSGGICIFQSHRKGEYAA